MYKYNGRQKNGKKYYPKRKYRRYSRSSKYPMYRSLSSKVKSIVDSEIKNSVRSADFATFAPNAGFLDSPTTGIVQGMLTSQRIGNWVEPVNIHGLLQLRGINNATNDTTAVRLTVFQWYNDQDTDPATNGAIMFDAASPYAPFSFVNKDSFKVLWTRLCLLVNKEQNDKFAQLYRFYIRLNNAPKVLYSGAALDKQNQIFVSAVTELVAAGDEPQIAIDVTFRYRDS